MDDVRLMPTHCHMEKIFVHTGNIVQFHPRKTERYHDSSTILREHPGFNLTDILLFYTKEFCSACSAFFYLQFGCVIFCRKNIVAKAAHIMLVKLAIGVHFINVLRTQILYEQNYKAKTKVKKDFRKKKNACKMLMSITPKFPATFCINNIVAKAAHIMLVKLATGVNFINVLHTHFLYEKNYKAKT